MMKDKKKTKKRKKIEAFNALPVDHSYHQRDVNRQIHLQKHTGKGGKIVAKYDPLSKKVTQLYSM